MCKEPKNNNNKLHDEKDERTAVAGMQVMSKKRLMPFH